MMMFDDNIVIKNEPIDDGDTEIRIEDANIKKYSPKAYSTLITFAGDDNICCESMIVKEEPRFNIPIEDDSTAPVKERTFQCYICKYVASHSAKLFQHFKNHILAKLFACHQCDRKFTRGSSLYHHQGIHLGVQRFECDECDRKFLDSRT